MNLIAELRLAASTCTNFGYRRQLADAADAIQMIHKRFAADVNGDLLKALNGAWSHGVRVLKDTPSEAPPFSAAGEGDPVLQRMAA